MLNTHNGNIRANRPATDQVDRAVTLKHVVDGFTYNTQLLYLSNRYFPNALAQLDILRRAANLRARWFCIPDSLDQPIQPYDTLYYQIQMQENSYVYGYQFSSISALNPAGGPAEPSASDLLIQLVDSCTGIPLFQDFANAGGAHSNFTARCIPILLTQPRLILSPALVNVEISNRTPNTITCQLLVLVAEPCKVHTGDCPPIGWLDALRNAVKQGGPS